MHIQSEKLIQDLEEMTRQHIERTEELLSRSEDELNWKSAPDSWSALECIEHLIRYFDYYLPEIDRRIKERKAIRRPDFKSSWLGEYFSKSMMPKAKLNKMKTFNSMNAVGSLLDRTRLEHFITQLQEMLKLLDQARSVSLRRTKTSISISNFIRLRLGDTFRVVIYHNERHMQQAERAVAAATKHSTAAKHLQPSS